MKRIRNKKAREITYIKDSDSKVKRILQAYGKEQDRVGTRRNCPRRKSVIESGAWRITKKAEFALESPRN